MFTTALHLSPSWARWTQSMFLHMISFKNHFNIILSTPRSSNLSPSFTLPYKNCVCISVLFHTIHTLHSTHPRSFETWIKFGKDCKSWRSSLCDFFPSSSSLGPNILLSTLFWNTLSLCSSLNVRHKVSHPYKKKPEYTLVLTIFNSH